MTVLTNNKGFTLYTFTPDTSTASKCNGPCATNWPPVKPGTASGVKGPFATIKRSDGSAQLTFHGHPLYTFVLDKSPGQAKGNGVNAFGGVWHEAPASGSAVPADPLRDVGHAYAQKLAAAGNDLTYIHNPDLTHGFPQFTRSSAACHQATLELADLIKTKIG